jgi:hypothetical protein
MGAHLNTLLKTLQKCIEHWDPHSFEILVTRELSGLREESPISSHNNLIDTSLLKQQHLTTG